MKLKQWMTVLKGKKLILAKKSLKKKILSRTLINSFDKIMMNLRKKQLEVDKLNRDYAQITKDITYKLSKSQAD